MTNTQDLTLKYRIRLLQRQIDATLYELQNLQDSFFELKELNTQGFEDIEREILNG